MDLQPLHTAILQHIESCRAIEFPLETVQRIVDIVVEMLPKNKYLWQQLQGLVSATKEPHYVYVCASPEENEILLDCILAPITSHAQTIKKLPVQEHAFHKSVWFYMRVDDGCARIVEYHPLTSTPEFSTVSDMLQRHYAPGQSE